jgi:hypothetical protein
MCNHEFVRFDNKKIKVPDGKVAMICKKCKTIKFENKVVI